MRIPLTVLLILAAWTAPLYAQQGKDIFSDPENLKVLPEDISPVELRNTMRGFAMDLGVRCETCHVGEAGQPLETFDFAADDKENKQIAREMLRMVRAINKEHIGMIEGARLEVTCLTCHRGIQRPLTTVQTLTAVWEEDGIDAVGTRYRELREQYHGTHSYDFSESVLADLAQTVARAGDARGALGLLELNDQHFPDSFRNHWLKGEVAMRAEDNASARRYFERALEIGADPRSEAFIRQRLESLGD